MNVHQLIEALPNWLVFAFVVVNMLALGMELTVREIVTPLRCSLDNTCRCIRRTSARSGTCNSS